MATSRLRETLLDPRTLAAPIFLYGVARAVRLSMTHDEALTYLFHVRAPWGAVLAHTAPLASNNHLLNTLLAKALQAWLPPTELALRVPALLGLAIFVCAAATLVGRTCTGVRRPLGMLLVAGNPFTLDLLVISRGYALALGLSLATLTVLTGRSAMAQWRRSALAAAAAGLAVAANVAFAYAFVAFAGVAGLISLLGTTRAGGAGRRPGLTLIAGVAPFAVVGAFLCGLYTPSVIARIQRVVANWGGELGFWVDTMPSLADGVLYGKPWTEPAHDLLAAVVTIVVALVVVLGAVLAFRSLRLAERPGDTQLALAAAVVFTLIWIGLVTAAHRLAGQRLPLERAASVLLPVITLIFLYLAEIGVPARLRRAAPAASWAWGALAATATLHFLACVNLTDTYIWRRDAATRTVMRLIAPAAASGAPGSLRLGVSWYLEPAVNFYRVTWRLARLAPVSRDKPTAGWDLYYLERADWDDSASLDLRECAAFASSQTVLAVPRGAPCPSR